VQRWLTILMPPLVILICCIVMVPRQNKLRQISKDIRAAQGEIQVYLAQLEAISNLPPDPKIASLPMTEQEQSDFLRGLSMLCNRTGNRMMSIASLAPKPPPPPPPPGSPKPPPTPDALPPDVTAIDSTIIFEGGFSSLRAFLAGLQQSRRLISMTDCQITMGEGGYPNLQTTLTVTRYVDTPGASNPGAPPTPAPTNKTAAQPGGPAS